MLTTFDDDEYVHFAVKFGAVGYLLKNMPPKDLIAAVRAVKHGSRLFSPAILNKLAHEEPETGDLEKLIQNLSSRERDILSLIMRMCTNHQIADHLKIAEQTVRNHISTIYTHFCVNNRMELIQVLNPVWDYSFRG
jgi:DNA-binding NarL/FixJ family response regulator